MLAAWLAAAGHTGAAAASIAPSLQPRAAPPADELQQQPAGNLSQRALPQISLLTSHYSVGLAEILESFDAAQLTQQQRQTRATRTPPKTNCCHFQPL